MRAVSRFFFSASILFSVATARASSPMFGAEMSVAIAQQLLATPPLPSLEGGSRTIAPQYGYVGAKREFTEPVPTGGTFNSTGTVTGNTAGLAVSIPTSGDLGYFGFIVGSRITGSSNNYQDGIETYQIQDVKADTLAAAGGISYRLLGTEKSVLALGVFVGPAAMKVSSSSKFQSSGGPAGVDSANFAFDPQFFGLYDGFQASIRLGKFAITPYAVMFNQSGGECQPLQSDGTTSSTQASFFTCNNQPGQVNALASFLGYGIFLGYGALRINVYSNANLFDHSIMMTSYSGSIGIPF